MSQTDNDMKNLADTIMAGSSMFSEALSKIQKIANSADQGIPEDVKNQVSKAQEEISKLNAKLADQLTDLKNSLK